MNKLIARFNNWIMRARRARDLAKIAMNTNLYPQSELTLNLIHYMQRKNDPTAVNMLYNYRLEMSAKETHVDYDMPNNKVTIVYKV